MEGVRLEEAPKGERPTSRENLQEERKWNQSKFWAEPTSALTTADRVNYIEDFLVSLTAFFLVPLD